MGSSADILPQHRPVETAANRVRARRVWVRTCCSVRPHLVRVSGYVHPRIDRLYQSAIIALGKGKPNESWRRKATGPRFLREATVHSPRDPRSPGRRGSWYRRQSTSLKRAAAREDAVMRVKVLFTGLAGVVLLLLATAAAATGLPPKISAVIPDYNPDGIDRLFIVGERLPRS